MHYTLIAMAHFHFSPQSMAPGQNKLSPTTPSRPMSLPLPVLLAGSSNLTIIIKQPNPYHNASSSSAGSSSGSRHHQPPLTMSSSVPHSSIGVDRKTYSYHSTVFRPATEPRALVSPQGTNADDRVLDNVTPESYTSRFNSSSFDSSTTSPPLERVPDQTPPLTALALLEALEREQLQEIYAKGGFAGFTAQEIEGWVAADR